MANYPISKTQKMVLDALNLTANDFSDADRIFADHGIVVSSKRVGRATEPVVSRLASHGGGWNVGGDGESYKISYKGIDLTAISHWMK